VASNAAGGGSGSSKNGSSASGEPEDLHHIYTDVNGSTLHHFVAGEGPPMVLLHGDSASAVDWTWVRPHLARVAHVHALDFPGHGDSSKPSSPYSPKLFADTVVAFLDALGIERAVLVGHSLGGLVAVRAALHLEERVTALCLVASGGLGRYVHPAIAVQTLPGLGEAAAALAKTPPGSVQRAWARTMLLCARWWDVPAAWLDEQRRLTRLPGFAEASLRTRRSAIDLWGQKELILHDLHRLRVPTLVVWGAADIVVPVSHGVAAMAELPSARLEVLAGCGHMPQVEAPAAFAQTLTAFLSDHGVI
jgi:pimeloyl-ACP methyl ester carboxylesterase